MTLAAPAAGTVRHLDHAVVAGSAKGLWTVAVSNAQATAATSTELKNPLVFAGSNSRWLAVPDKATRVMLRHRYEATTVTAAPVIYAFGFFPNTDGVKPSTTTNQFSASDGYALRLDAVQSGSGTTLTSAVTTDTTDATYFFGTSICWNSPYFVGSYGDLCGASWVMILCSTASDVSGGNDTSAVDALFL